MGDERVTPRRVRRDLEVGVVGTRNRAWGELEDDILRRLRTQDGALSVRELQGTFTEHVPAYTTVLTALDRLERKGLVVREAASPRRQRFRAAANQTEHASEAMLAALGEVDDRAAALLSFAGNLEPDDVEILRRALQSPRKR